MERVVRSWGDRLGKEVEMERRVMKEKWVEMEG